MTDLPRLADAVCGSFRLVIIFQQLIKCCCCCCFYFKLQLIKYFANSLLLRNKFYVLENNPCHKNGCMISIVLMV